MPFLTVPISADPKSRRRVPSSGGFYAKLKLRKTCRERVSLREPRRCWTRHGCSSRCDSCRGEPNEGQRFPRSGLPSTLSLPFFVGPSDPSIRQSKAQEPSDVAAQFDKGTSHLARPQPTLSARNVRLSLSLYAVFLIPSTISSPFLHGYPEHRRE